MRRFAVTTFILIVLVAGTAGTTAPAVHASSDVTNNGTTLVNPLGDSSCSSDGTCISSFLTNILSLVIKAGTVAVILMLVYVGFLFVTAQGEPAAITKARNALLWTVVGALILLGSQAIATGIKATVSALGKGG